MGRGSHLDMLLNNHTRKTRNGVRSLPPNRALSIYTINLKSMSYQYIALLIFKDPYIYLEA